jgi:hypothetical protein
MTLMTFSFRNRFIVSQPLNGPPDDRSAISLYYGGAFGGLVQILGPQDGKSFNHARELRLRGDDYETLEKATNAGKLWRDRLTVAFAHYDNGIEIGLDAEPTLPEWGFSQPYFVYEPKADHRDSPKLTAFQTTDEPIFSGVAMQGVVARPIETLILGPLNWVSQRLNDQLDPKTALAYKLFHASHFESNPETAYILLFTGIEALIPEQYKTHAYMAVLEDLRQTLDEMDGIEESVRDSIDKLLAYKENESIRFRGRKWVLSTLGDETYAGETPETYFLASYDTRNKIAHGNVGRPNPSHLRQSIPELRRFLLALLDITIFGELMPTVMEYCLDGSITRA